MPLPQIDSSAAEQAVRHARGRVKEERGKLAQAGLGSLWHQEAPHGRFLKLEHLSLPQDLKKKVQEQEENEKLAVSTGAPPPVSQLASSSSDVQADKQTPSEQLANGVYAFITAQEASETQTAYKIGGEAAMQATLDGSLHGKQQESAMDLDNPGTTANEIPPQTFSAQDRGESERPQETLNLDNNDSSEGDDSDYDEESEESDAWPPSPPMLRFKMRMQFSNRFKPT
jgi:hypothetical protein